MKIIKTNFCKISTKRLINAQKYTEDSNNEIKKLLFSYICYAWGEIRSLLLLSTAETNWRRSSTKDSLFKAHPFQMSSRKKALMALPAVPYRAQKVLKFTIFKRWSQCSRPEVQGISVQEDIAVFQHQIKMWGRVF